LVAISTCEIVFWCWHKTFTCMGMWN
jgi:hypothetical protein